ncbi:hypothetical protein [Shewanella mangrovi]|uniref:hypothetical protein n=1 Tax=Shewanella mangrovi TaxID=1515746 RepID=UPI0007AD0416|nr:hypothetical protein [Shewanella mangrovi]
MIATRPLYTPLDRIGWLNTTIRCVLALLGSYANAVLLGSVIAITLSMPAKDATMSAIMLGFVVQLLAVIWVFYARTLIGAFVGLALPATAAAVVLHLLGASL